MHNLGAMESTCYLTCLLVVAAVGAYELSPSLAEFYCVFNGRFTNKEQVDNDPTGRTLMAEMVKYLYIPALSVNPVLYFELTDGDVLAMAYIGILTEDKDGVIHMEPHNFTDISHVRPGTVDENFLRSLTPDRLQEQPGCGTVFVRVDALVFDGVWPECKHFNKNGDIAVNISIFQLIVDVLKHNTYKAALTCDGVFASIPTGAPEKSTLVLYTLLHTGNRYPPENAPDDYICNCRNSSG